MMYACAQVCVLARQSADRLGLGAEFDTVAIERNSGDAPCTEVLAAAFPSQGSGCLQEDQRSWRH